MCFDIILEIINVRGIAIIADIRIVVKIVHRFVVESCVICDIANAAPVLDFWKRNSVTKEIAMTSVFTEPSRIRNCSRFNLPVISEPMIAAWLEPSPGKNEHIGDTRIVAMVGLKISFLLISNFPIFCFGIIVFDFIECIMVEVPKSPVKSGRRGCWILRFREDSPRNPARMKIIMAFVFDSFSL